MDKGPCAVADCGRKIHCRQHCRTHYDRFRALGVFMPRSVGPVEERFWSKVDRRGPDECWPWTPGTTSRSGHGQFSYKNRMQTAHRMAFILTYGPVPGHLVVRHRCMSALCVNPAHLELGTVADNNTDIRIVNRALRRLAEAHKDEFAQLLDEERVKAGRR